MMPSMRQEAVSFAGSSGRTLRGILHCYGSKTAENRPAIIFLHGWPGNRLGPHRMFVKAARRFAADGWPCLRLDFAGRGDSDGDVTTASITTMVEDTRYATRFLADRWPGRPVLLLGICSGAKVAIGAADASDIAGLVLWSAERMGFLADAGIAARKSAHSFKSYLLKILRPESWKKLVTGTVNFRMVSRALLQAEVATPLEREEESAWLRKAQVAFRKPVLLVFGTGDPDAGPAAAAYQAFFTGTGCSTTLHTVSGANHSYYSLAWEADVIDTTHQWLRDAATGT